MKNIFTLSLLLSIHTAATAVDIFTDGYSLPEIKTALLYPSDNPLGNPVIQLNGNETLLLKFDLIAEDIMNYEYTIVSCNSDWTKSMMFTSEYINGYQTNTIYDYRLSASQNNTRYVHYWTTFPNSQMTLSKSGNYVVQVFKSGYPDSVVLTKRFMVFEPLVEAAMFSQQSYMSEYYNTHQELRFDVHLNRFEIQNPIYEIKATLMQNFRWDNAIDNIPPVFADEGLLRFRRDGKYVFPAGKEFRYFDIRNILARNERIRKLDENKTDSVYLYVDKPRKHESYRFMSDINGRFVIGSYPWTMADYDANYVKVIFYLQTDALYRNGDIYVIGKFSDWQLKSENKMIYEPETRSYYAVLLLKQGFYNYIYAFAKENGTDADATVIEGDYFEAENEYQLFVYHRPAGARYDRLIAYRAVDSFGNQRN